MDALDLVNALIYLTGLVVWFCLAMVVALLAGAVILALNEPRLRGQVDEGEDEITKRIRGEIGSNGFNPMRNEPGKSPPRIRARRSVKAGPLTERTRR